MFFRFKHIWITVLLAGLLSGAGAWSYLRTAGKQVLESAKKHVPIEFEIARARDMVQDLVPAIRSHLEVIATEEAELQQLAQRTANEQRSLNVAKQGILERQRDLQQPRDQFVFAGRNFSRDQVARDLTTRFERFKSAEARLKSLADLQEARENTIRAARNKLDSMVAAKRQLEVELEQLQAQLHTQQARQMDGKLVIDDSKIGDVQKLIRSLRVRMDVADRVFNQEQSHLGEIPLDTPPCRDIGREVADYFATE